MVSARVDVSANVAGYETLILADAGGGGGGVPVEIPTSASASTPTTQDVLWAVAATALAVASAFALNALFGDDAFPPTASVPVEGLTIFAVFYVAAQAIERLLEPISSVLLPKDEKEIEAKETKTAAVAAVNQALTNRTPMAVGQANQALFAAATAKAVLKAVVQHRAVVFWALASVIGMAVSAGMKLYVLQVVGISNASRVWEVLATGLIIGAGTKPLHELVGYISAKKEETEAKAKEGTDA